MSETTEHPTDQPAPDSDPQPEAGQETEQQPQPEPEPPPAPDKRHLSRLTGRLNSLARERDELAARLAAMEQARAGAPESQWGPDQQQAIEQAAQRLAERRLAQERQDAFHEAGREAFTDWQDRCQSLIAMGADTQFADLLVEMRDGAKIAAALADEPDEVERIAALKTERARAVALGQFAARLEAKPPQPARRVSNAPPPIRPVTGRANPTPNEYVMTSDQLVQLYSDRAMQARQRR